jgi:hypothetical protein
MKFLQKETEINRCSLPYPDLNGFDRSAQRRARDISFPCVQSVSQARAEAKLRNHVSSQNLMVMKLQQRFDGLPLALREFSAHLTKCSAWKT